MSNELTVTKNTLPVKSMSEIMAIGEMFDTCGMFGCTNKGQGLVLAMTCVMEGKTPIEFNETYHLIQGRPSMRADAMLANLLKLGGTYRIITRDEHGASAEFKFRDASYTSSMSWKEAQTEPYIFEKDGKNHKRNWATPRARMQTMWARVVSDGVRVVCPLANKGSYTPEENMDTGEHEEHAAVIIDQTPPPIKTEQLKPEIVVTTTAQTVEKEAKKEAEKPLEVVTGEIVDFTLMPVGDGKGKPFNQFPVEILTKVRNNKKLKSILPEHIVEIDKVIAEKEAESAALIKADDAMAESGAVNV